MSRARLQIKAALDGKGVPCELRVYDDEGHGLARRANLMDASPAALAFSSGTCWSDRRPLEEIPDETTAPHPR